MSSAQNLNALLVGGLAVAAVYVASRGTSNARPSGATNTGQAYTTPTTVAEQLARGVVALTQGFLSGQPKGVSTENTRTAFRQAELQAQRTAVGWGGPSQSIVMYDDPNGWALTDSTLSAPVYNPSTDLVHNPFAVNAL